MIAVISGTNRPNSNSIRVARLTEQVLADLEVEVSLIDLQQLPLELFSASSYGEKPAAFAPFQDAILAADGIITVIPEYNGSFPGVLKVFIDMLRFPESLADTPAAFIGLSSGRWGALRAVEHLQMVFQYRHAHVYARRVFLPGISALFDEEGRLKSPDLVQRLREMSRGFVAFCGRLRSDPAQ